MSRQINSVAVMGTGTMGAGIAALCANAGYPVLFMDMPAREGDRNGVAAGALQRMKEGKSPMLKDDAAAARITVGNFEDDMAKLADIDWMVEVIVEDLAIKRSFFQKVEANRRPGSIVSTNTSGIMLKAICEGMPESLCRDIAVTHFFNPVLVMKLVELVPGANTDPAVISSLADFLGGKLGKGVVYGKDTVNFIANRIGCYWLLSGLNEAQAVLDSGKDVEDIDAIMSKPVGVPPTGLYGLVDLVGLDVLGLVGENLKQNLPAKDVGRNYTGLPERIRGMIANKQIGRKVGAGFYRMSKDAEGNRLKETYDLKTGQWRPSLTVMADEQHQTLDGLMFADDALGQFAWKVMGGTLLYAADLVPEIADDIVNVDRAMRWGFAWRQGPFEMIDALGPDKVVARLQAEGRPIPKMLQVLQQSGAGSFYRNDGKEFLGTDGKWHAVP